MKGVAILNRVVRKVLLSGRYLSRFPQTPTEGKRSLMDICVRRILGKENNSTVREEVAPFMGELQGL